MQLDIYLGSSLFDLEPVFLFQLPVLYKTTMNITALSHNFG